MQKHKNADMKFEAKTQKTQRRKYENIPITKKINTQIIKYTTLAIITSSL